MTEKIIGCVHQVSNILGPGFLEKVYENAPAVELGQAGLQASQQRRIEVHYKDVLVGSCMGSDIISIESRRRASASIGG